jgi:flagellar biosynthesis/type III secretory pathway protein FliH
MTEQKSETLQEAATRFDGALTRLEAALAASVAKVADLARRTGFEDGHAEGLNAGLSEAKARESTDLSPILREELEASRKREAILQEAVSDARDALDEAIDDIRTALGPL